MVIERLSVKSGRDHHYFKYFFSYRIFSKISPLSIISPPNIRGDQRIFPQKIFFRGG